MRVSKASVINLVSHSRSTHTTTQNKNRLARPTSKPVETIQSKLVKELMELLDIPELIDDQSDSNSNSLSSDEEEADMTDHIKVNTWYWASDLGKMDSDNIYLIYLAQINQPTKFQRNNKEKKVCNNCK